jgi:hypothetical protein
LITALYLPLKKSPTFLLKNWSTLVDQNDHIIAAPTCGRIRNFLIALPIAIMNNCYIKYGFLPSIYGFTAVIPDLKSMVSEKAVFNQ